MLLVHLLLETIRLDTFIFSILNDCDLRAKRLYNMLLKLNCNDPVAVVVRRRYDMAGYRIVLLLFVKDKQQKQKWMESRQPVLVCARGRLLVEVFVEPCGVELTAYDTCFPHGNVRTLRLSIPPSKQLFIFASFHASFIHQHHHATPP